MIISVRGKGGTGCAVNPRGNHCDGDGTHEPGASGGEAVVVTE